MMLSLWLFPTFTRDLFGGLPFKLWLLTVYFWAEEVPVRCFFFHLDVLHNGSRVAYDGTFGLFDVSASDLTAFVYAIRSQVARVWKAARRCSACLYPNDLDANFCQACGSRTSLVHTGKPITRIDHVGITRRFQEFADASRNKSSQRQKSALERQLSGFLASLSPPKCVSSFTSDDIIKFLISRDKSGRTVVHTQSCPRVGCNCPSRLAAGSVDSLLGKLRAIFNNIGRLHDSNPVAHPRVKEYLKFIRGNRPLGLFYLPRQSRCFLLSLPS